jgi:hypothetical protein
MYGGVPIWGYLTGTTLGLGYNTLNFTNASYGQPAAILRNGLQYAPTALTAVTLDPGVRPSPGQLNAPDRIYDPNGGRPPRVNQWNVTLQREVFKSLSVEAAYVGTRGIWLPANALNNVNAIPVQALQARGLDINNPADQTLLTSRIDSPLAASRGFKAPYAGYPGSATVAQTLRPFPQYNGGLAYMWAPLGNSWYDSLQAKATSRNWHGVSGTSSFTFAKALSLGTEGGINDVFNRPNQKGLQAVSQPWVLAIGFAYETPKIGKNKLLSNLLGHWTFGGMFRDGSGALIAVPSSNNNLPSTLYQTTRMNRVAGQPLFTKDPNCHCIDPNKDFVLNPKAWSDAPAGQWGYSSQFYDDYRWAHQPAEQFNVGRSFRIREGMSLQVRAEFFNVFNRINMPAPTATNPQATQTVNSLGVPTAGFGRIDATTATAPRNGQLVARFQF